MSGPQFFETRMGRQFFEVTMPELVRQLHRLNDLLALAVERMSEGSDRQDTTAIKATESDPTTEGN